MTRILSILLFLVGVMGWITGCGSEDRSEGAAPDSQADDDTGDAGDAADETTDALQDPDSLADGAGEVQEDHAGDPAGDPGDAEPTEPPVELPVAACSMAPYTLLPSEGMGVVVDWHYDPTFDLSPALIQAILEEYQEANLPTPSYGCRVVHFRYATQDRGQPVEATAVLGLPANAELPEDPMPFVVFLHGTTGFSDPCAPSRDPMDAPPQACLLASLGYVAVLPDYIGMVGDGEPSTTTHAYVVGEQVAIGSWDALRGARRLLEDDLSGAVPSGRRVVLWGGSQGGHAALYTELYGPYYAPEYEVLGVVAAVPPIDLVALTRLGMESLSPPTVALVAMMTSSRAWYGAPADLSGVFTDLDPIYLAQHAEEIVFPQEVCNPGEGLTADSVDDLFLPSFIDAVLDGRWEELQPWTCYLGENSLATSSVAPLRFTPTLTVFSENDDLVVTAPQRLAFDRLCGLGYTLEYLECAGAGHAQGAVWSLREQIDWINARIAGEPVNQDRICVRDPPACCSATPEGVCPAQ